MKVPQFQVKSTLFAMGSDDFRAYVWEIPPVGELLERRKEVGKVGECRPPDCVEVIGPKKRRYVPCMIEEERFALQGHRSIVNSVVFHPHLPLIATAGVEKVVRLFAPFPLTSDCVDAPALRPVSSNPRPRSLFQDDRHEETMEEDISTLRQFDYLLLSESFHDALWGSGGDSSGESDDDANLWVTDDEATGMEDDAEDIAAGNVDLEERTSDDGLEVAFLEAPTSSHRTASKDNGHPLSQRECWWIVIWRGTTVRRIIIGVGAFLSIHIGGPFKIPAPSLHVRHSSSGRGYVEVA
ncbi:hypothetical protein HK101_004336 [Irineochytrium annulatum]|nr:hypothetical protein HK101_004336 [Irineochytrium annulatum]